MDEDSDGSDDVDAQGNKRLECKLHYDILKIDKALMGLEYVVELYDRNAKARKYFCVLCDRDCERKDIIQQVCSFRHRFRYLDLHFPSIVKILNAHHRYNTDMSLREEINNHIAKTLEEYFYRRNAFVYELKEFEDNKAAIVKMIKDAEHYSEIDYPDCEKNLLGKFNLNERDSSDSDDEFSRYANTSRTACSRPVRSGNYTVRSCSTFSRPAVSFPNIVPSTSKTFSNNADLKKYRETFQSTLDNLDDEFEHYRKSPDQHPMYENERSKFKSHSSNDLEWARFWSKRVNEFYEQEIEKKRKELRQKYQLTYGQAKDIEKDIVSKRKPIKFEIEYDGYYKSTPDRVRAKSPEILIEDNNLVAVCRYLSVFENELGMLTPKILDLLSRSVAKERHVPNSSESLLFEDETMNLLYTVKEKFKGGLSAGIISSYRTAPVKKAITYIARLIYEFNQKYPKRSIDPIKDENEIKNAQNEISLVFAEVLAAQGKSDLSTQDLQSLVESFLTESLQQMEKNDVEEFSDDVQKTLKNLTEDDLITLLRNFSELTSDEQNSLIEYLSKLEKKEPERVNKLRKYVDMGDMEIDDDDNDTEMVEDVKEATLASENNQESAANQQPQYSLAQIAVQQENYNHQMNAIMTQTVDDRSYMMTNQKEFINTAGTSRNRNVRQRRIKSPNNVQLTGKGRMSFK